MSRVSRHASSSIYFDLALLPETLLFSPMTAMLFNCGFACLVGLLIGWWCESVRTRRESELR
jgi:hypothetical protein